MRKLTLLTCLLVGWLSLLSAASTVKGALTYSVEAEPFPTDYGNNFAYYHVNLDLADLTQVAKNGLVKIAIDFQKGMEIKETRFESKPNGAVYYVTDLVTPVYNATVTDPMGNILLQNTYGGFDKSVDYGRAQSLPESELATRWLNEKDQYLQRLEFRQLDFTDLQADIIKLLETAPIVVPVKQKAQPKRPEKVRLPEPKIVQNPTATEEVTNEVDARLEGESQTPIDEETSTLAEANDAKEMMDKNKGEPINEEAAATEPEVMQDPFAELNEPLAAEMDAPAPAAPIDYEEKAQKENRRSENITSNKKADRVQRITPALSDRRNLVKLNLPNLSFGNITLNYERLLSARNSVSLHLGYIRPQTPISVLNDAFEVEDELDPAEFSGITATAEYRIYGKKKGAGRGFYIAPYARYANHKLAFNTTIDDNFTNASTQLSTIGIGGQVGAQWLIKDRVVIDWGILGLAAQWYTFKSTFTAVDSEIDFDEIRAELEAEFDDSIIGNKLEFSNTDESLSAKMPFLFGGARAYFSVGYKF
ncbi:MAG: hypothetical protein AAGJ18_18040 [Bacteroidota bacterium]